MNNIIVCELKTLVKQRGIKGYYKTQKSWVDTQIGNSSRCERANFNTWVRSTQNRKKISEYQRNSWSESKSALKKFPIQYRIDEQDWFGLDLLLVNVKQSITNHLIDRPRYKVKLILSCMVEKVDLKSDEVIANEAAFQSKTEVNWEGTNSKELFSKMKETVLGSLAKFQRQESNWRFRSVF